MSQASMCVIFNPTAGKNRGQRRLDQVRRAWGLHVEFRPTQHPGHATDLAEQAARAGVDVVVAAGGDGTAHEVLNGLMRVQNSETQFSILPIGSANDYAYSLGLEAPMLDAPNASTFPRRVDVGVVRAPGGKQAYFGCCLGMGLNGRVTWEARRIRRLQGVFLYGLATLRALLYHYELPATTFHIDDEPAWTAPTLLFSALIGKREGGFVLAPAAKVDDGWLDYVHAGALSRWEVLQFLPRLALFGPPKSNPKIRQERCRRVQLHSKAPLIIHTDGEFFCLPDENLHEVEIEVLPGVLTVTTLARGGRGEGAG